ncbi:MAG: UxaA family hydrolase [Tepidisphaeraceae bacterium]
MSKRCFQIHAGDNVATLLDDAQPGETLTVLGQGQSDTVQAREPVVAAHKIALVDIEPNAPVVKFGVTIGVALASIRRGDWVHLHNCRSQFDERSQTLDVHSGATTDTKYE